MNAISEEDAYAYQRKETYGVWLVAASSASAAAFAQKGYIAPVASGEITQPVLTDLWRAADKILGLRTCSMGRAARNTSRMARSPL